MHLFTPLVCTDVSSLDPLPTQGDHWPQTDGKWLMVEQRAGLTGLCVGVSLGAFQGGFGSCRAV